MSEKIMKVLANVQQGLTDEQKAQARSNIGAQATLTAGANITISNNVISSSGGEQVNADWTSNSGLSEILHKPYVTEVKELTGSTAYGPIYTNVPTLTLGNQIISTDTSGSSTAFGIVAPVPTSSDHGKMVVVNHDVLDFAEVPNGIPTTSSIDQYLTTNGSGTVEWDIKPICRATESSGGDIDLDICRQIQISNDYANHNETVELVGVGGGSGITTVGVLPPANPAGDKILGTDSNGKVVWDKKYTAGNGITISANNQIAWEYSVGRNLHLNQNNAIQTNIPGGIWDAPAALSNSFTALSGANFAGAYRLGCRHNINDKYELGIIYTASGLSSTITFIGTETVIGLDNSVTTNQAVYIEQSYYTPSNRFGYNTSTQFDPTIHKAIYYSGVAQIGPTSDTKIAIWQDNGNVKISFTSIEVGKVGSTL